MSEWYVDKGFVRGGFYDELGGMLVGHRAREVCDMLNAHSQLQAELSKQNGYLQEIFDAVNIPMDNSTAWGPLTGVKEIMRRRAALTPLSEKDDECTTFVISDGLPYCKDCGRGKAPRTKPTN
jgi:hypothetical protein